mgnify:CR=1 FL=1
MVDATLSKLALLRETNLRDGSLECVVLAGRLAKMATIVMTELWLKRN